MPKTSFIQSDFKSAPHKKYYDGTHYAGFRCVWYNLFSTILNNSRIWRAAKLIINWQNNFKIKNKIAPTDYKKRIPVDIIK